MLTGKNNNNNSLEKTEIMQGEDNFKTSINILKEIKSNAPLKNE